MRLGLGSQALGLGALFLSWAAPAQPAEELALGLPVACAVGRTCVIQNYVDGDSGQAARDYACGSRTYDGHNGTDFRLPHMRAQRDGVLVIAAAAGRVEAVRDGVPDISVRRRGTEAVAGKECGNGVLLSHGEGWTTQYCHLAQDSVQVRRGDAVGEGQRLGRIGLSGKTEYPHLHFTVRRHDQIVDPFAYAAPAGVCGGGGRLLWKSALRDELGYRASAVLNAGFAAGPVTMRAIEDGAYDANKPSLASPALVAFVRAIGLQAKDVQRLSLQSPAGDTLIDRAAPPLDRNKAQAMLYVGKKRPAGGFRPGRYVARYQVLRNGSPALEHRFDIELQ